MTADVSTSLATPEAGQLVLPSYERPAGLHPPLDFEGYRSTALRHPKQPLVLLPHRLTEVTGPLLGDGLIAPADADLTTQHDGEPQGQRIIVTGQVLDSGGRPVPDTLIEIWHTNAAGRYRHWHEHHPAPLDPNFDGIGRAITDSAGRYRFVTIAPGAYPWGNHYNAPGLCFSPRTQGASVRTVASIEGPDGAPVVILANPIGTTRAIWDAQARVLREDFRLLRFELRGHGAPGAQSDAPPGPYSIADLGTDVLGLMREHGVATAAYCGISIGGMMGLWLAANAPERISSLVVCCAALTPMPSRQAWLDRAALVRSGGMAAISEMVPPRWFTPDFIARQPAAVAFVMNMLHGTDPEGYAGCGEAIAGLDLRPALGAIKAPTLVMAGAEDLAAPPWQGAMTATGIADSRLRVIRGASHLAPYQVPGPVTDAIRAHLAAS